MKNLPLLILIIALAYGYTQQQGISLSAHAASASNLNDTLQETYRNHQSDIQVQGEGTVIRILPDDTEGSRHQRFILKISNGQTLLIAHNIDLAPRINGLKTGDRVEFYGEYEWNAKGGVIHWTHHDPNNSHTGGWLKHQGKTYQ